MHRSPRYPLLGLALLLGAMAQNAVGQCTAQAGNPTATLCGGAALNLNGSGTGLAPLGYAWSGSPYLSSTNTQATTFNYPVPVSTTQNLILTLTVTDASGCVATDQVAVTVNPTPSAVLTTNDPNPDLYVGPGGNSFALCGTGLPDYDFQFTDAGSALPGATYLLNWGTPPAINPGTAGWSQTHNYPIGLHTITYTVTNPGPGGCATTSTIDVFLGSNPSVGTSNPGNTLVCSGTPLTFPINTPTPNSPGTQYVVDYGDGNGTTFGHPPPASVTYNYPTTNCPGAPYTFRIDAITPCPITSFGTAGPIYITDTPQASFTQTSDTACTNAGVTFTNTSLGVGGFNCSQPLRVWTISPATGYTPPAGMGDLNGSTQPNQWTNGNNAITVQFTQPGTYCITLHVGNTLCGTDEVEHCVCIEAPPQPAFTLTPDVDCAPFASVVDNTSVSPNSCRTTYAWNVGTSGGSCGGGPDWSYTGGTSGSSTEPQFLFSQAGTYSIQLAATNSCGTYNVTEVVTANAPPQVDVADLTGICATQCVDPSAVVQNCGAPITTYDWTFPGGTPATASTLDPPQICYAAATSSSISLTVTNACGSATDVTTLAVGTLPAMPVIASNSPICAGQILSLSASSTPGVTFQWTGPDGFSSNSATVTIPNVAAVNAGVYSVVAVSNGCSGPAATINVQVIAAPTITVTPSSDAICNGETATFTANGAGNYQWFIGAALVGTGPLFNTSPAITTTYTVSGDLGGCPGSTAVPVTVYPVTNVNAGAAQTFCDQAIGVQLNGFPSPGTWSGPHVSASGVFTPVPDDLGPFTVTYTHVDGNGCTNDDDVVITVEDLTQIAYAGADTFFCQGPTAVTLPASPPGGTWIGAGPGGQFTPSTVGVFIVTYNFGTGTCATSDQVEVQVLPAPVLDLPPDIMRCADSAPEPLNATPAGGIWVGPGVTGPPYAFDPAAVAPGLYVLTYTYSDGSGCTSSGDITATVMALPLVSAGPDVELCDQPIPFQLSGDPVGGTWSATTMTVTPSGIVTPDGPGTDIFTYTYTSPAGCSRSDQITVDVVAITQPAFAGNDTAVCVNSGAFQLSALPVGGTWSGPQVSSSGLFDPSLSGSFTLTYSFGSATCLLQDQVTITVNALPIVDAGDEIATCPDGGIQVLTATPTGGAWSGTGVDAAGNFDPMAALPGGNPVTYSYTDPVTGCSNSDSTLVTVNPLPVAAIANDPVACANVPFPFINNSSGASSFEWDFGDTGTSTDPSPSHSYSSTGTYTVRLIAITGANCRDTVFSSVDVWDVPQAEMTLSADTGCGPLLVDFTNTSTGDGVSYVWDLGGLASSTDQVPPTFSFPQDPVDGITYPITLTVTNVCGSDTDEGSVTVIPEPTAVFGPNLDEYCPYTEVPFGNASYGLPDSFFWDFGDGNTSNDPGPVVTNTYANEGAAWDVTVTLTASNVCGTSTATQVITIQANEVTSFFNADPIDGCSPVTVDLTQYSSGDTAWYWDLGDGNVSNAHDLQHTYNDPGTYTIELFNFGCGFDSYTVDVEVYPSPVVAFTTDPASVCVGEPFTFTNLTPDVANLQWDFGDLTGSTLSAPEHVYAESGTYDVTLTATSISNSCTASLTQQVVVNETPQAAFTTDPANGCIDLQVSFLNSSVDADFNQWDFGDDNTSSLADPFHTYAVAGTYTVELVAENLTGCTDSATAVIVAHPLPTSVFSLSADETCDAGAIIQTYNASQGAIGYLWDFGNGTTSELNQPQIGYDEPGTYTITLTSSNQFGCEAVSTALFIQHPSPVAAFTATPQPGCEGYPISFANGSVDGTNYAWEFGDGAESTADQPLHIYDQAGTYSVELIAYGEGGCSDTLAVADAILINTRPFANYTTDTLESISHALQFSNTSEGAMSFTWDFDDGETSTVVHPLHVFPADGGGFTVCLVAVNELGCPDTLCKFINVAGDPNIFVPNAFTPNGDTRNDDFRPVLNGFVGWNYRFLIFDRWGMPIYDSRDRNSAWDGTYKGQESPVDVYVWKVIVERDGDAQDFVGSVSLVR
ncbi:MAG TPA: PKD domain-containing protein [Flavobacteriales bacterium]|nr:PKD domain-containing protein [Flavobacteriales bacterium]